MDATHNPDRRSWAPGADAHAEFPIQNLPLGVFTPPGGGAPRGGVAIGDMILDLSAVLAAGLVDGAAKAAVEAASGSTLNAYMALAPADRAALRAAIGDLLDADSAQGAKAKATHGLLHAAADCTMQMPAKIGDYTDFYAGIHHAVTVGTLFRPDNPLLPNYKWVPIGYHGRASSIGISGGQVVRPKGQLKAATDNAPTYAPCKNLDCELELGLWVGRGNALGSPIPIAEAADQLVGISLLNDWSARDIQTWEYQPLGPFLAKNFATTISPWVVTAEALAPFRTAQPARPEGDPAPLDYLSDDADQAKGAFDIKLEVYISSAKMRAAGVPAQRVSLSSALHLYWTAAQLITHHASNGCNLSPGDLLGTGTISGPDNESCGSLLEMCKAGREPFKLGADETRTYLLDGDELSIRGVCEANGARSIGFGECKATIVSAA